MAVFTEQAVAAFREKMRIPLVARAIMADGSIGGRTDFWFGDGFTIAIAKPGICERVEVVVPATGEVVWKETAVKLFGCVSAIERPPGEFIEGAT